MRVFFTVAVFLSFLLFLQPWHDSSDPRFGSDFPWLVERSAAPSWVPRVLECADLNYVAGSNVAQDRMSFVRSASSLRWVSRNRLAVVQDDSNFLGLVDLSVDPSAAIGRHLTIERVVSLALPRGLGDLRQYDRTRSNKRLKFDLESMVLVNSNISPSGQEFLLVFGSGSKEKRRDLVLYIELEVLMDSEHTVLKDDEYGYVPKNWKDLVYEGIERKNKQEEKEEKSDRKGKSEDQVSEQARRILQEEESDRRSGSMKRGESEEVPVHRVPKPRKPVVLFYAQELYQHLRLNKAFSGSELNIEGVDIMKAKSPDGQMMNYFRFFERGNGEHNGDEEHSHIAVSASADIVVDDLLFYLNQLCWKDGAEPLFPSLTSRPFIKDRPVNEPIAPPLHRITHYGLGFVSAVPLTFTDLHVWNPGPLSAADSRAVESDGMVYLAGAEDSESATTDGDVKGVVVGFLPSPSMIASTADSLGREIRVKAGQMSDAEPEKPEGFEFQPASYHPPNINSHDFSSRNWKVLVNPDGSPFLRKAEGIVIYPFDHQNRHERPQHYERSSQSHLFTPDLPLDALIVLDQDEPTEAAELCFVRISAE